MVPKGQTDVLRYNNNNNNQAFWFQASWGRLDMKQHELKNKNKTISKKGRKQMTIKKLI
jgi:hypothetical protein